MTTFTTHTIDSAPEDSKPTLEKAVSVFGFLPNLLANLAESHTALNAYMMLAELMDKSSLNPEEQQVAFLAISVENNCEFCVSAHSLIAKKMIGVDPSIVENLRNNTPIKDNKMEALAQFSRKIINERGWVEGQTLDDFIAAGFSKEQALDVIVAASMKTISNYANHLTGTTINEEFKQEKWQSPLKGALSSKNAA